MLVVASHLAIYKESEMARAKKSWLNKHVKNAPVWYGIMLDYELDAVPGYWPIRCPTTDLEALKTELWVKGNPGMLPSEQWEAKLKQVKSLSPPNTGISFSGGIYEFTYLGGV